jgi:hypothetical protein
VHVSGLSEGQTTEGLLEDVAATADSIADDQRQTARQARDMAQARRRGATWQQIIEAGPALSLLGLLRGNAERLSRAGGRVRSAIARGLAAEGFTTRQIGKRFGVSHQRVSSLLSREDP